jgi:RNA polymerase sigma factor (sigma-70 family)
VTTGLPDYAEVIRRCFARPDQASLTEFDRAFRPYTIVTLISICHDRALAEDAYQSAFVKYIKLFRAGPRPGQSYEESYFVAIAKHCLIDALRKRRQDLPIDELLAEGVEGADEEKRIEARIDALQGLMRLDPRCRHILESYYLRGDDSSAIASRIGVQRDSVHMALKRCRESLRRQLAR